MDTLFWILLFVVPALPLLILMRFAIKTKKLLKYFLWCFITCIIEVIIAATAFEMIEDWDAILFVGFSLIGQVGAILFGAITLILGIIEIVERKKSEEEN